MFNMTKRLWNINKIFSSRLSRYYGYDVEANVVIWTKYVMFKAGVPDCVGGPEFFLDRHPGGRTLTLFDVDCGIQLLSWLDGSVVWIWPTAHQLMTTGLGIILDTDCLVLVCLVSLKRPLQIWLQSCKCSVPESVPVTVIISGTLRRWSEPRSTDSTQIAHFSIVIFLKSGGCSPWVYRGGGWGGVTAVLLMSHFATFTQSNCPWFTSALGFAARLTPTEHLWMSERGPHQGRLLYCRRKLKSNTASNTS